ncbi:MAG: heavy-metal-associated domain-containing protein [Planctomycetota bacterium]
MTSITIKFFAACCSAITLCGCASTPVGGSVACQCEGCDSGACADGACGAECCAAGECHGSGAAGEHACEACDSGEGQCEACRAGKASIAPVSTPVSTPAMSGGAAVLSVDGMACPMCASNATLELGDLKGVRDVTVDLERAEVTVVFDGAERPTRGELARAIDDAGFTLRSIDAR